MTALRAIDGGRHWSVRRYGLALDADIPPLLAGARAADLILQRARELRILARGMPRREWRAAVAHLRRAWIGHCCGSLALCELEFERAWAVCLRHSPVYDIAANKYLADSRRHFKLDAPNRERNRKIRDLAGKGIDTDTLGQRFGLSTRQIRRKKKI